MKVFKEQQRFTQTWFIVVMVISVIIPLVLMLYEFLKENSKFTTTAFLTLISIMIVTISPVFFFKLSTRIDVFGIHYKFFLFTFLTELLDGAILQTPLLETMIQSENMVVGD
ncbi:hypothetical protein [Tenacibaculum sp. SG-28]|uniref:hypothetical protein n=1 Tax=Tenacibaculum sp. SG-28 TaxID=754426 RepID=UPI000D4D52B8|nr:hypothetical protein [Tenacibaculum sp. SG-28]PQJ22895.1 hypothetical protein BSU00_00935 [Tenacibaculum sp. SG-28]